MRERNVWTIVINWFKECWLLALCLFIAFVYALFNAPSVTVFLRILLLGDLLFFLFNHIRDIQRSARQAKKEFYSEIHTSGRNSLVDESLLKHTSTEEDDDSDSEDFGDKLKRVTYPIRHPGFDSRNKTLKELREKYPDYVHILMRHGTDEWEPEFNIYNTDEELIGRIIIKRWFKKRWYLELLDMDDNRRGSLKQYLSKNPLRWLMPGYPYNYHFKVEGIPTGRMKVFPARFRSEPNWRRWMVVLPLGWRVKYQVVGDDLKIVDVLGTVQVKVTRKWKNLEWFVSIKDPSKVPLVALIMAALKLNGIGSKKEARKEYVHDSLENRYSIWGNFDKSSSEYWKRLPKQKK